MKFIFRGDRNGQRIVAEIRASDIEAAKATIAARGVAIQHIHEVADNIHNSTYRPGVMDYFWKLCLMRSFAGRPYWYWFHSMNPTTYGWRKPILHYGIGSLDLLHKALQHSSAVVRAAACEAITDLIQSNRNSTSLASIRDHLGGQLIQLLAVEKSWQDKWLVGTVVKKLPFRDRHECREIRQLFLEYLSAPHEYLRGLSQGVIFGDGLDGPLFIAECDRLLAKRLNDAVAVVENVQSPASARKAILQITALLDGQPDVADLVHLLREASESGDDETLLKLCAFILPDGLKKKLSECT